MRIHASKPVEWLQDGSTMDRVGFAGQTAKLSNHQGHDVSRRLKLMGFLRALFVTYRGLRVLIGQRKWPEIN
jgi:hypothetical protein